MRNADSKFCSELSEQKRLPLPAVYTIQPPKKRHDGETSGGAVTVYDLRRMTREQIEAHGLRKYVKLGSPSAEGGDSDAE